jgi:hypothetical protein
MKIVNAFLLEVLKDNRDICQIRMVVQELGSVEYNLWQDLMYRNL